MTGHFSVERVVDDQTQIIIFESILPQLLRPESKSSQSNKNEIFMTRIR